VAESYFNYFTEIEEHFQKARGTSLFLLSPLDWALIESWKNAGIPVEAALRGIDAAFEKWRIKKNRFEQVNSIAYCAQAVAKEAATMAGSAAPSKPVRQAAAPFTLEELQAFLERNAARLRAAGALEIADAVAALLTGAEAHYADLEQLEQRLSALEDKLVAQLRACAGDDRLFAIRRELDAQLRPYRSKMSAEQLAMLERQFLDSRLLEDAGAPRLSLFYLGAQD
jgi:hypothetical protein